MKPRFLTTFAAAIALASTASAQSPGQPPKDGTPPPPPAASPEKDGAQHQHQRGMRPDGQMLERAKQHIEELRKAGKNEEADQVEKRIKAMQEHMAQMHREGAPGTIGGPQHHGPANAGGPQQHGPGLSPEHAEHLKEAIKQLRLAGLGPIADHLEHGPGPHAFMQHGGFGNRPGAQSGHHGPPWADASGSGQHHHAWAGHGGNEPHHFGRGGEGEHHHHGFSHHGPPWADAHGRGGHHGGKGGHHHHHGHGQRGEGEHHHHGFSQRGGESEHHHHGGFSQRGGEGEHHHFGFGQRSGGFRPPLPSASGHNEVNAQIEHLARQVAELSKVVAGLAHARGEQPGARGEHARGPSPQGQEHHERRPQGDQPQGNRGHGEHHDAPPAAQPKPEHKADQSNVEEIRPAVIPTSPKTELAQLSID